MPTPTNILESPIEYLKGVGPTKGDLLKTELGIYTFRDLLFHFPFRYVDKTKFHKIRDAQENEIVQLKGVLRRLESIGDRRKKRLVGTFRDDTGVIELIWFKGIFWLEKNLVVGKEYIVYGRVSQFNRSKNIPHPEMEEVKVDNLQRPSTFAPVYPSTEKLSNKGLDAKGIRKLQELLLQRIKPADIPENLPDYLTKKFHFASRYQTLNWIHFPKSQKEIEAAQNRLKFEELFFLQLRLLQIRRRRKNEVKGHVFSSIGDNFNRFFNEKLPFELTGAQKRVLKEIRRDLGSGIQMNRLLQGDVGSGKTVCGLMTMLIALDNGFQACMMAPTEILAQQHFSSITESVDGLDIRVEFLSGTVKGKKRKAILEDLAEGHIHILIGTHALIEDPVVFKNLGLE